jgi:hypothetical protein
MVTRYRLHDPVIGFIQSAKQVVTIPAGAIVTIAFRATPSPALCTVAWDGKLIEAYRMDVEQHGTVVSETSIG